MRSGSPRGRKTAAAAASCASSWAWRALSAADVSVALSAAGSGASEWSVQLASDDVRDAAYSLRVAHEARREAQLGLALILAPALCAIVVAAFGFAPVALSPIATWLGTAAALSRLRADR